jgi:putative tricarboxylic transport membrane protein
VQISNALAGVLLLALSVAVFISARSLPNPSQQAYGPGAFPTLVAVLLAACSLLLVWQGRRELTAGALIRLAPWTGSIKRVARFVLVPASVAFYVLFIDDLGFLLTAGLVLIVLFLSLGVRVGHALAIAIATVLLVHTVFDTALKVQLPWGLLEPVRW